MTRKRRGGTSKVPGGDDEKPDEKKRGDSTCQKFINLIRAGELHHRVCFSKWNLRNGRRVTAPVAFSPVGYVGIGTVVGPCGRVGL